MKIQRIVSFLGGFAIFCGAASLQAQQTVTDQYGTEILMDVLPTPVQGQVYDTQVVLDSGGGTGPLAVDRLGRFKLDQAVGIQSGPSQDELLVNQLLGVVLLPRPGDVRPDGWPGVEGIWHDFDEFPRQAGLALQQVNWPSGFFGIPRPDGERGNHSLPRW